MDIWALLGHVVELKPHHVGPMHAFMWGKFIRLKAACAPGKEGIWVWVRVCSGLGLGGAVGLGLGAHVGMGESAVMGLGAV